MKKIKFDATAEVFHDAVGITFERSKELAEIASAVWQADTTQHKGIISKEILEQFDPKDEAELLFAGMMIGRVTTSMELGYTIANNGTVVPIQRKDKVN